MNIRSELDIFEFELSMRDSREQGCVPVPRYRKLVRVKINHIAHPYLELAGPPGTEGGLRRDSRRRGPGNGGLTRRGGGTLLEFSPHIATA